MIPLLGEKKSEEPAVEAPAATKVQRPQPQRKNRKRK
jgi:YidC/Oxa1 family membrane protein insertase